MIPCYITSEMSDDFEEALRLGAEAGIETVHLRKGLFGKDIEQIGQEEIDRILTTLDKFGMRIGVLMPPFGKCDINDPSVVQKHHEIFERMVDIAGGLGTKLIRCFPFTGLEPDAFDAELGRIANTLRPAVERAEAADVLMCFEVVDNTIGRTAQHTRRVLDALDSPAVAAIWELMTAANVGETPSRGYPHLRGTIRDIHIKPNADGTMDPLVNTGENLTDVVTTLAEDGYAGMLTIEHWHGTEGTLDGLRILSEALDHVQV
ncbi:MAG: hypothetical protein CME26_15885 [Gemmatimonadetes bacterium]|nr:hypothetical protein [Gemmatimonadota bacterium]